MVYLRSWIVMSKELEKKKTAKKSTKGVVKKTTKKESLKKTGTKKVSAKKTVKVDDTITLEEAESFYHVSLLAQAVCVIGVLAISVLAIFEHSFTIPIEVLVGITLLIMAYNNVKLFKRKGLTIIYIVFGIISLFVGILGYFGVTL